MPRIVNLGGGEHVIGHGYLGDDAMVIIERAPRPGPVGADAIRSCLQMDRMQMDAVVITFENIASLEVLEQQIAKAKSLIGCRRGNGTPPDKLSVRDR